MPETFTDVHLEAEHVTERHDPDPKDKDQPLVELPGLVNVYLVIDGGRLLLDTFKAPRVFAAIEAAKHADEPADTPANPKNS